ncbi:MAG: hypothetical protein IPO91_34595 [Chloroflexi bacterium]|nr:hypothetical protein [Chloroflexota bacterium]
MRTGTAQDQRRTIPMSGTTWSASTGLTTHYDTNYLNTTPNWANRLYADPARGMASG